MSFSVSPSALQSLPPESLATIETVRLLNYIRAKEGLPAVIADAALQAAAQAHAQYDAQNSALYTSTVSVHDEPSSTAPGYTGKTPSARDEAFGAGVYNGLSEILSTGTVTPAWSFVGLMDTLFHRFGALAASNVAAGAGYAAQPLSSSLTPVYVSDIGQTSLPPTPYPTAMLFPWNGAHNVWPTFQTESPDPLQGIAPTSVTSSSIQSGYPISVTFDHHTVSQVTVQASAVTGPNGQAVPTYLVDASNYTDQNPVYSGETMGTSVALFPKQPLAYQTTYTASVSGTLTMKDGSTQPFSETWSFTTVGAPTVSQVFQDGGYVFVVGKNLENSAISTYYDAQGNGQDLGNLLYAGSHYLAYQTSGKLSSVQVTDSLTGNTVGNYNITAGPFSDTGVSASSLFAVDASSAAGLVEGFPNHTFQPDANVTGAQAIVMLYRALGSPALAARTTMPTGVPSFAENAIAWADANGVILASDGFQPYGDATRAQLATWLMRAYNISPLASPPTFSDASQIPASMQGYVAIAQADGVVSGYPDGTFRPQSPVSRGAFAIWALRLSQALQSPQNVF